MSKSEIMPSALSAKWTVEALKSAKFRGPVAFYDGNAGMARQDFECVDEPRFGYFWRRENYKDRGRQAYMVDGAEVASLEEACALLAQPPNAESPKEVLRRHHDEFMASPKLDYGATRALSEARCNADTGAFGMVRAAMQRGENAWHRGINRFSDIEREAGRPFPHWLYHIKSAAHESYRAAYLFQADAEKDTNLVCALGKRCRDCPMLQVIETTMREAREEKWPSANTDMDIIMAKTWTCIGHILTENADIHDGQFFSTQRDREHEAAFNERLSQII